MEFFFFGGGGGGGGCFTRSLFLKMHTIAVQVTISVGVSSTHVASSQHAKVNVCLIAGLLQIFR